METTSGRRRDWAARILGGEAGGRETGVAGAHADLFEQSLGIDDDTIGESANGAAAAGGFPGRGRDGRCDQFGNRVEIDFGPASLTAVNWRGSGAADESPAEDRRRPSGPDERGRRSSGREFQRRGGTHRHAAGRRRRR